MLKNIPHLNPSHSPSKTRGAIRHPLSLWITLLLVVLIFAVYGQVLSFDFTNYDDPEYVIANPHIAQGVTLQGLRWALTSGYASNWLPLTWVSHMLDVQLFGLNAGMHHVTSVLLHAMSTILLFAVLRRMTGTLWRSALVAALFALHPLRVESVAWIAERKDVLSTFFWMLTLWCYARYTERPGVGRYLPVVLSFALGLMAKPMLVTLPFALLLLDIWPLGRITRNTIWPRVAEKLPLLALAAAAAVINYLVQRNAGSVMSFESVPLLLRLENALVSYAMYLWMLLWPTGLAPLYPIPLSIPLWQPLIAAVVVGAISYFVYRQAPIRPYLSVGWLWYLGTLVPVLGLVLVGAQARADRYTYIPCVGILIMVVWGTADLVRSRATAAVHVASVAAIAACAILTFTQVSYWRDSITLFRHTIAVAPDNYMAYNNLGVALRQRGDVDEAIECFRKSIAIPRHFDLADPYTNMGAAMLVKQKPAEAIPYLLQALEYKPESAVAHANLGLALDHLDRTQEALVHFREAIRIDPADVEAHSGMGVGLAKTGDAAQALTHVREAIQLRPNFAGGYFDLGEVYGHLGQPAEAESAFAESIRRDPSNPRAHFNLGTARGAQGKLQEAAEAFRSAVRLKPDYVTAWFNLGSALAQSGQLREAEGAFTKALQLDPSLEEAREALLRIRALLTQP